MRRQGSLLHLPGPPSAAHSARSGSLPVQACRGSVQHAGARIGGDPKRLRENHRSALRSPGKGVLTRPLLTSFAGRHKPARRGHRGAIWRMAPGRARPPRLKRERRRPARGRPAAQASMSGWALRLSGELLLRGLDLFE